VGGDLTQWSGFKTLNSGFSPNSFRHGREACIDNGWIVNSSRWLDGLLQKRVFEFNLAYIFLKKSSLLFIA
jgi:hypothetical protein